MWRGLVKFGLWGLGASAVLIGSGLSLFGPEAVANFFNHTFGLINIDGPITDLASLNIESELRFFGMMFVFYGAVILWTLRDYETRYRMVPVLLGVFFLAGIARLIGFAVEGPPQLLFKVLMIIELGLPIILGLCWWADRKNPSQPPHN